MKKLLLFAETCFVVFGLTFFAGGITLGSTDGTGPVPEVVVTSSRYFIWVMSTLLLMLNAKRTFITIRRDWVLWIFTGLALSSFIWSELPDWTLSSNRELWQMTSFGLYLATRFTLTQQIRLYALTFMIGGIASAILAVVMPSLGKHGLDHPGAWKGIYDYKNTFGSMMVLAIVAFFSLPIERPRDHWIKWGGIAAATALILLTTSKTALGVAFAMLGLMMFYRNFRWKGKRSVILSSLGALIVGTVSFGLLMTWVNLVQLLGKDPTFSGRTYIWQVSLDRLLDHPWLGYGRSAFWAPDSPYPKDVSFYLSQSFRAPHAHNGFIDTALDVGLIGLGLFLIIYVSSFVRALLCAYDSKHPEHLWAVGYFTFFALNNMTESYVLRLANIFWVLFIATVLTVKQRVPIFEDEWESIPDAPPPRKLSETRI